MMRHLNVLLAFLLATFLTGVAQGEILLFQKALNVNRGDNKFTTDHFDLDLILGDDDFFDPNNPVTLFDTLVISPADVGNTYDSTAAYDPNNFPTAAVRLTDALNEIIKIRMTEDSVGGSSQSQGGAESIFFNHPTPPEPPDLAGDTVGRVSLRLDAFVFVSPLSGDGVAPLNAGQPFDVDFTVFFYAVPEPATVGLLLFGLMAVGVPTSRRRPRAMSTLPAGKCPELGRTTTRSKIGSDFTFPGHC
jgi:hypothetical protein